MTRKHSPSSGSGPGSKNPRSPGRRRSGQRPPSERPPSQRSQRVAEEIRHALADIMLHHHLNDPDLEGKLVTVTGARVSPDLRNATVFVLPLGGQGGQVLVKALNRAQGYFRGELARRVALRLSPNLRFEIDESFGQADRIEELLRDPAVQRDLKKDE